MPRRKKFLAVTPVADIPWSIREGVLAAFKGTRVRCQLCNADCVVDAAIDIEQWQIFYCIDCSAKAGLTLTEVVEQLVTGLSISYTRFLLLMEVLRVEPGTRRYEALVAKLQSSGVQISGLPESESTS